MEQTGGKWMLCLEQLGVPVTERTKLRTPEERLHCQPLHPSTTPMVPSRYLHRLICGSGRVPVLIYIFMSVKLHSCLILGNYIYLYPSGLFACPLGCARCFETVEKLSAKVPWNCKALCKSRGSLDFGTDRPGFQLLAHTNDYLEQVAYPLWTFSVNCW